jgi:DNA processing protein
MDLATGGRAVAGEFAPEELLGPLNEVEKKNAPARLYVAGHREILDFGARVSIVGSRRASRRGLDDAGALSEKLASQGVVIVSGLAEGIDTSAHMAAIGARGRTVAILGTPLDEFYPAKNRDLQALIMREHLCLSQFPAGAPSQRGNFPMRNRTMALVSDATVIVEAGDKSGSLHQGWEALRLGRPLFLLESVVEDSSLAWPREMERYGAQVVSLTALDLVFEFLPERTGEQASPFAL